MKPFCVRKADEARELEREKKYGKAANEWRAAARAAVTDKQRELYASRWRRAETKWTNALLELNR